MSFGSSSVVPKAKHGDDWKYKIYFDTEADNEKGKIYDGMKGDALLESLPRIAGTNKAIVNVWAYKVPLSDIQLTKYILYHMFIVFETQDHTWWSIEKHTDGISLQRSGVCSAVRDRYKRNPRKTPIEEMGTDKCSKGIHDLFQWLEKNEELDKVYNYLESNCQHFAKSVFNHLSVAKKL